MTITNTEISDNPIGFVEDDGAKFRLEMKCNS